MSGFLVCLFPIVYTAIMIWIGFYVGRHGFPLRWIGFRADVRQPKATRVAKELD